MEKLTTNAERLSALEKAFQEQVAKAYEEKKTNNIVSISALCKKTGVHRNYIYGNISMSDDDKKLFAAFRKKIDKFIADFQKERSDDAIDREDLGKQLAQAKEDSFALQEELSTLETTLASSLKRSEKLLAENTQLRQMVHEVNTTPTEAKVLGLEGVTKNIICPDAKLEINGRYEFSNPKQRDIAWEESFVEFQKLMKRKVPQRVYLLVGPPCVGKSTWASKDNVTLDRHSVIIDATNLTVAERAQWLALIPRNTDVKVCIVRFLVDEMTLRSRNAERTLKRIDVDVLEEKIKKTEEVNPRIERVDEVLYVRSDDE